MRLHIDGEPARLFFRYKKTFVDKHHHVRTDLQKQAEKFATSQIGSISHTELEQAIMAELPPNITECYIVKGWNQTSSDDEGEKLAFGRSWRHPKDPHNKHMARAKALAHAIVHWPRPARKLLWVFLQQHGKQLVASDTLGTPQWVPWTDLNIVTNHAAYTVPESPNKGTPLRLRNISGGLDQD